jgi:AbrB family looped-hinge helix DNA binding protein
LIDVNALFDKDLVFPYSVRKYDFHTPSGELHMSIIKVKTKGQVTIPTALRTRLGVAVGDFLEAQVEGHVITLTPKTLVDKRLAEGLADIKAGRVKGPFKTAEEMLAALSTHQPSKPGQRTRKTTRRK